MKKRVSIVLAVVFCAMMLPGYTAYAGYYVDHEGKSYFVPESMEDLENAGFVEMLYDATYGGRFHGEAAKAIRLTDKVGTGYGGGWFQTGDDIWLQVLVASQNGAGVWTFGPAAGTDLVKEKIVPNGVVSGSFTTKAGFIVDNLHFKTVKVGGAVVETGTVVAAGTQVTVDFDDDYRFWFEPKKGPDELKVWGPKSLEILGAEGKATIESRKIPEEAKGEEYTDGVYTVSPINANFNLALEGKEIVGDSCSLKSVNEYLPENKQSLLYKTGDSIPCAKKLLLVFGKIEIDSNWSKEDIVEALADHVIADGTGATIIQVGRGFSYKAGTITIAELLSDDAQETHGDVLPGDTVGAMKVVKLYWTERSEYHDPNPAPSDPPTPPSEYHEEFEGWGGGCDAGFGAGALTLFALAAVMMKRKVR